jgi:hypothetical protein
VSAAEDEVAELLADAQRQAATLQATAEGDAEQLREQARVEGRRVVEEATREAGEMQRIAEVFAEQTREKAEQDARKQLGRARELAAEVLADGTEMAHNLRQLSESLRHNAETILRDVQRAHRAMTAKLDEAGYDAGELPLSPVAADRGDVAPDFGDVPEFVPRRPRRFPR